MTSNAMLSRKVMVTVVAYSLYSSTRGVSVTVFLSNYRTFMWARRAFGMLRTHGIPLKKHDQFHQLSMSICGDAVVGEIQCKEHLCI